MKIVLRLINILEKGLGDPAPAEKPGIQPNGSTKT